MRLLAGFFQTAADAHLTVALLVVIAPTALFSGWCTCSVYAAFSRPPYTPDDVCFQPYTSGSTGRPKGVLLTHRGQIWNADIVRKAQLVDETERALGQFEKVIKPKMMLSITSETVAEFVARRSKGAGRRAGEKISPATINKELRHLRAVLEVRQRGPNQFLAVTENAGVATPGLVQKIESEGGKVAFVREFRPSFDEVFAALVERSREQPIDGAETARDS